MTIQLYVYARADFHTSISIKNLEKDDDRLIEAI